MARVEHGLASGSRQRWRPSAAADEAPEPAEDTGPRQDRLFLHPASGQTPRGRRNDLHHRHLVARRIHRLLLDL